MHNGEITIVGIDCAVDPKKVGLALGKYSDGQVRIDKVRLGGQGDCEPVRIVQDWVCSSDKPTLISLDAPLGWPKPLSEALTEHNAGKALENSANNLFRRDTDRFVKENVGKLPLDVGANLIARTAHSALELLAELRRLLDKPVPLAWEQYISDVSCIEVYPAATLIANGIDVKTPHEGLEAILQLPDDIGAQLKNPHLTDAIACVLAAQDFLKGSAYSPADSSLAKKEGWIWVRQP